MAHDHRMNPVGEPHLNKVNRMRMEPTTDPRNTNDDWFNLGEAYDADWNRHQGWITETSLQRVTRTLRT